MIDTYTHAFTHLNCNKHMGQVAPRKAIMLLSVIDLFADGLLSGNESFWHLRKPDGTFVEVTGPTASASMLKSSGITATLDSELYILLQDKANRDMLRNLLIDTYLSAHN